jgi:DNA-binding SARP family transcriptional activator
VIRFQTLGTPDLTGADGHTVGSVLAGPKRVALLAYLALEGANGLVRRDSLLPLFWPESDTDRARASLRSALLTLRRSLGEGVVVTRGDDEVGIGDCRLWCDAVEFRRLRAAGELEQALELYRGEFLQGFFLSEAPEFDHWLDRTRQWLRDQAVESAVALARRHEASGDPELAARWAARAAELDPDDERLLRQRLELLERSGKSCCGPARVR